MNKIDYDLIFRRRHPEYRAKEAVWLHNLRAYGGGEGFINEALIRHVSEVESEYLERRKRACYFNYPQLISRRITQYVLAVEPQRRGALPELAEDWSRQGERTNEVMRRLSTLLNVFGQAALVVESPGFNSPVSLAEAQAKKLRPFVRAVSPLELTDWFYGDDGELEWAVIREGARFVSPDPFRQGHFVERCRLYERDCWRLLEWNSSGVECIASGVNVLGKVPVIPVKEPESLSGEHWFNDAVRISEAILNNESEAQMNVVKQMYGLLVVPEAFARGARQNAVSANNAASGDFAAALARSAALIEAVEEKGICRYISPTGVAVEAIRSENDHLKEELFETAGLGFRNRNYEAQSAESKAWDFRNLGQFLAARADLLEQSEVKAWELMHGFDAAIPVPEVVYNRKFALNELADSIAGLLQLSQLNGGAEFQKAVHRTALELLDGIQAVPVTEKERIIREIEGNAEQKKLENINQRKGA